ncbi:MAG: ABC transporter ATP-binding protein [Lentisphaeria bacterium]|nr:ABC transporter ATP-binding protein [Lentisphaeria bacterium]
MINENLKKILSPYKGLIAAAIIAQVLFSIMGLAVPWILKIAIDRILPGADYTLFAILAGAVIVLYGMRSTIRYISGFTGTYLCTRVLLEVRNKLFRHLQSLSLRFYEEYRTGKLISNIISDVGLLNQLLGTSITLTEQIFAAIIIFFLMFILNWKLGLVVLCFLPFHFCNFAYFRKILRRDSMKLQERMSEVSANLSENINGIKVVKSFARERSVNRHFFEIMRPTMDLQINLNLNSNICICICDILTISTYLVMIFVSISLVKNGSLTLGEFAAFFSYTGMLLTPISYFAGVTGLISQGFAGATRVSNLLAVIPEIKEDPNPVDAGHLKGEIIFDKVNFKYRDTPVIQDFSLHINPGEKVAFVGPSGCGKSTASNLILRFYDVLEGKLTVDGIEVKRYSLESYRNNIGVVLQEPFLFSGTIYDNIAFAKKDSTREEIERAARLANIEEFILKMPNGYDTVIGENGASLSGGQKQRIAIARAILKDPSILILDEATSALDTISEHMVQEALDNVMQDRTTIIIAHRLSTIKNADKIVVLRDGHIMQCGTHDELMAVDGIYKELYTTQTRYSNL